MTTFVLVHGAWLGGWCWKYVAPDLRSAGDVVYTPTLTGLGERDHLGGPDVDTEIHVTDVANVIEYEDLSDVVLVGHSYGGLVVTGVLARVPDRIERTVYLDAMVPMTDDPASFFDMVPSAYRSSIEAEVEAGDGWRWPMPDDPDGWNGISPEVDAWARSKAVGHPVGTLSGHVSLGPAARERPATYVICTENGEGEEVHDTVREFVAERGWTLEELDTGHWPMLSTPNAVTDLLCDVTGATPGIA